MAALYWHIRSRHDLLLMAVDHVWAHVPLPCLDGLHWRPALLAMADNVRALCVRHPWILTAMVIQPLDGPAIDRHDRHLLTICEKSGLTREDAEQAAQSILTFADRESRARHVRRSSCASPVWAVCPVLGQHVQSAVRGQVTPHRVGVVGVALGVVVFDQPPAQPKWTRSRTVSEA